MAPPKMLARVAGGFCALLPLGTCRAAHPWGIGNFADAFARALIAGYGAGVTLLLIPGAISEMPSTLWLLVFGVRLPKTAASVTPQQLQPTAR
jgi:hypothetical protein